MVGGGGAATVVTARLDVVWLPYLAPNSTFPAVVTKPSSTGTKLLRGAKHQPTQDAAKGDEVTGNSRRGTVFEAQEVDGEEDYEAA